jgi:uncharacterized protein (TIGR03546 family)
MVRQKSVQRSALLELREPWQRGLAIALGLTLGLLPKLSLPFVGVLAVTLLAPIPLTLCLVVGTLVALIAPQLSAAEQFIGSYLLSHPSLQDLWESLFNHAAFRAFGINNTQTLGSLAVSLACFYPTYLITTIYFQRKRTLDVDGTWQAPKVKIVSPQRAPMAAISTTPLTASVIDSHVVDSVMSQRPEASPLLSASNLLEKPVDEDATVTTTLVTESLARQEWVEAERVLNELVTAKQIEIQAQLRTASNSPSQREYEEQQWVLDTLIEIIRLKDEALRANEIAITLPSESISAKANLLAPIAENSSPIPADEKPSSYMSSNTTKQTSENSMDKFSRTDNGAPLGTVNVIDSPEQVERLSSSPPSSVNVVPHGARPRSMHARDESLRFLIHHLQCLQRERQE